MASDEGGSTLSAAEGAADGAPASGAESVLELDNDEDVDQRAILGNKVSVTPIHYDLTDYAMFEAMKKWDIISLI